METTLAASEPITRSLNIVNAILVVRINHRNTAQEQERVDVYGHAHPCTICETMMCKPGTPLCQQCHDAEPKPWNPLLAGPPVSAGIVTDWIQNIPRIPRGELPSLFSLDSSGAAIAFDKEKYWVIDGEVDGTILRREMPSLFDAVHNRKIRLLEFQPEIDTVRVRPLVDR